MKQKQRFSRMCLGLAIIFCSIQYSLLPQQAAPTGNIQAPVVPVLEQPATLAPTQVQVIAQPNTQTIEQSQAQASTPVSAPAQAQISTPTSTPTPTPAPAIVSAPASTIAPTQASTAQPSAPPAITTTPILPGAAQASASTVPVQVNPAPQVQQPVQTPTPITTTPVTQTPTSVQAPVITTQAPTPITPTTQPAQAPTPITPPSNQPTPVTPTASTPAPDQSALPQEDVSQIATIITAINTLKSSIQDQLKDTDEKIYEARMLDAQAKKLSFTILDAPNDTDASKVLSQVQEASKKIQQLEEAIKNTSTKNIDDSITKIQDNMKTLEDVIKKLNAQGISFQAHEFAALDISDTSPDKTLNKQALSNTQQTKPSSTQTPITHTNEPKSSPDAPLIQYDSTFKKTAMSIFNTLTDGFITGVNYITRMIKKVYRYIESRITEARITEVKTPSQEQQAPKTPNTAPITQPVTPKEQPAQENPENKEHKENKEEPVMPVNPGM